ncbi:hypothetical protein CHS0354_008515 [Potamilus streckersoni]|uniref:CARD domain-containing protein n=1 Tax=Potamilus streckersoni TaxID=2493646 RepID=A0AAE0VQX6_9BIVA|nr:hypothetical protein CHS0354_008515 [Potamilus streckersoni]
MNYQQKEAIKQHQVQMMDEIMPTEKLFAALNQNGVFDKDMIEKIKAEKTETDQVSKMLNMLPKRGPCAFDGFIRAIQDDYPWLTAQLNSTINQIQTNMAKVDAKACMKTEAEASSKQTSAEQSADPDVKSKVGIFVRKQFGQSKRLNHEDIKAMEKFLADKIQQERKHVQPLSSDCEPGINTVDKATSPEPSEVLQAEVQNKLNELHKKCEPHVNQVQNEINNNVADKISPCDATNYVTLAVIETDLDIILDRLVELESHITEIHEVLGDPEKKSFPLYLVREIKQQNKQYEKEINQERQKNENMLTELYNNSKNIKKLENLQQQMKNLADLKNDEISRLRQEKLQLQQKFESLYQANMQHAEKEKTLENLRKLVEKLQESKVKGENANYRQKVDSKMPQTKKTGSTKQSSTVNQQFQYNSNKGRTKKTTLIKRKSYLTSKKP